MADDVENLHRELERLKRENDELRRKVEVTAKSGSVAIGDDVKSAGKKAVIVDQVGGSN